MTNIAKNDIMWLTYQMGDVFNYKNSPYNKDVVFDGGHFYIEMMGLIGAGNNPMVGMTVAVAVAIEEASK